MVWEELKEPLIKIGLEAETFEDVMTQLGTIMIKEGYAKETYVDALIEREKEFPTGLDINGIGVAIPHTDVSHVNKEAIGIGVLKKPVTFLQMGTDDEEVNVQLVFMLTVVNPNAHMEQLQRIIQIIQDTEVLKQLLNTEKKAQIIEVIREKENTL